MPRGPRPPAPLNLSNYDGMKCPYTGDVWRLYQGRLVLESELPTSEAQERDNGNRSDG